MRANAIGLEVFIIMNREEFSSLKEQPLKGEINFRGVWEDNDDRKIPFEIIYSEKQRDLLDVKTTPKHNYFGEVNNAQFSINNEFYYWVETNEVYGDRFFGPSGKFQIKLGQQNL